MQEEKRKSCYDCWDKGKNIKSQSEGECINCIQNPNNYRKYKLAVKG